MHTSLAWSGTIACDTTSTGKEKTPSLAKAVTNAGNHIITIKESIFPSAKYDTTYMDRRHKGWYLQVFSRFSGTAYKAKSPLPQENEEIYLDVESPMRVNLGLTVNYRTLSASVSVSPDKLFKKNNDRSFRLSSNGNRIGGEISYHSRSNFKQKVSNIKDESYRMEAKKKNDLLLTGYYVFNARKFSHAAAMTQSWKQKRSAGSFWVGATYFHNHLTEDWQPTSSARIPTEASTTVDGVSINPGYAYNYVTKNGKWLLHFSASPGLIVYNGVNTKFSSETGVQTSQSFDRSPFPNWNVTGRFAFVRYFEKGHLAITANVASLFLQKVNDSRTSDTEWRGQLTYGFQL